MRKEPIDIDGLKQVRESINIPIIANGDVKSLDEANKLWKNSKSQGVMVANGLLTNPGLFRGDYLTPLSCVQDWIDIDEQLSMNFMTMHHHLIFMLDKILPKNQRLIFNNLQTKNDVLKFLDSYLDLQPNKKIIKNLKQTECIWQSRDVVCKKKIINCCDESFELLPGLFDENLCVSG